MNDVINYIIDVNVNVVAEFNDEFSISLCHLQEIIVRMSEWCRFRLFRYVSSLHLHLNSPYQTLRINLILDKLNNPHADDPCQNVSI